MALLSVRLASILLAGLLAGATVCVFFVDRSLPDSGSFYVLYKQRMIQALTVPLVLIAMLALLAVAIDAFVLWRDPAGSGLCLGLAVAGLVLIIGGGIVTKVGHFPINHQIMTWDAAAPPAGWSAVQARWFTFHLVRTTVSTLAFAALTLSNLLRV